MVLEQKILQQDEEEQALKGTTTSKDSGQKRSKWKGRNSDKTEERNQKQNGQHDRDQQQSSNGKARIASLISSFIDVTSKVITILNVVRI